MSEALASGYNLPPGCFESDLPGNRPQDVAAERVVESIGDEDLLDEIIDTGENADGTTGWDHAGACIYEVPGEEDNGWYLEVDASPPLLDRQRFERWGRKMQFPVLRFDTRWDALAYAFCFHYGEIEDAVTERKLEQAAEDYYFGGV